MNRTRNASRNVVFGTVNKAISLLLPFVLRSILIKTLGVEYVGLGTLFASILQVLNLAELGISTAIVYGMYGAVANDDSETICRLMNFYKKAFRIIGIVILVSGLIIAPFLRYLISGDVPEGINIYLLYFVYLSNTCLTYFLFAYKTALFTAHQRSDVVSKVGICISICTHVTQAILLLTFKNYYFYVFVLPLMTIINNVIISLISKKKYPSLSPHGEVEERVRKEINKKVLSLFLYKIGGVVLSSVDTIIISSFLGLSVLGRYNNYYYIITALFGFLDVLYSSLTASVGNSIKMETKSKNKADFGRLLNIQGWLVIFSTACLVSLYQPFMRLWVGEDLMFPFELVICLSILFFVWRMMDVVNLYKNAAGLWEHDKWRQLVGSAFNLALNIALVNFIGIYGIVISTIASIIVVIFPWSSFVLFKYYFNEGDYKKEFWCYVMKIVFFAIIACLASPVAYLICGFVVGSTIWHFLAKMAICIVVVNVILVCAFPFFNDFKDTEIWVISKIRMLIHKR